MSGFTQRNEDYRTYQGPELPSNAIAILGANPNITICSIDGISLGRAGEPSIGIFSDPFHDKRQIQILPGPHAIGVVFKAYRAMAIIQSNGLSTIQINAIAGHAYYITYNFPKGEPSYLTNNEAEMIFFALDVKTVFSQNRTLLMVEINFLPWGYGHNFNPIDIYFLIFNGVDINAKDSNGNTALMYAVAIDDVELVEQLINMGADIYARDNAGLTALDKSPETCRKYLIKKLK